MFEKIANSFREACLELTGYEIKSCGGMGIGGSAEERYEVSSMYAADEVDKLIFSRVGSRKLELLSNDYATSLDGDKIQLVIQGQIRCRSGVGQR